VSKIYTRQNGNVELGGMNDIKKVHAHKKKSFIFLSIFIVLLLSSCASEQREQNENSEAEFTAIPVSPLGFDVLMERGSPWVVSMTNTGEPFFVLADNVFQAADGSGMLFATVPDGFGFISTSIQGYDPVSGTMHILCERFSYDYRFFMHEDELFVAKYLMKSDQLIGIFRPALNRENRSFDLVQVDDELFTLITRTDALVK